MSLSNQKPIKENNNFNVLRKILRKTKESNLMGVRYYPEDETSYWYHPTFVCQKYVLDNEKKRVYSYLESFGVTFADLLKSGAKTGYEIDHIIGGTKEKTKETKKFIVETKYKIKKTTYNFSQNDINFSGYDSELYVIDWGRSEKIKRKLIKFNNKIKKNNDNIYELKQTKNGTKKTFTLKISKKWKSGIYAVKITAKNHIDYIPFFVRPQKGTQNSKIVFLVPTATYIAYANWNQKIAESRIKRYRDLVNKPPASNIYTPNENEYIINNNLLSLYDFHSDGSGVFYSSRMRPMMNLRPHTRATLLGLGESAPISLSADLHLIDWLEQKGFNYDVITDEDLNNEGHKLIEPYKVVITGAHPEYWTHTMLQSLNKYTSTSGKLMYLGGNGFYWVTSFDTENPHILEVRRWHGTETYEANPGEYYHSTTGELGGIWKHRGLPPQKNVGVGFTSQGFDVSIPYKISKESINNETKFIFEGVNTNQPLGNHGLVMDGAAGFEIDRADKKLGTPANAKLIASAQDFSDAYQHVVEEVVAMNPDEGGTKSDLVRSDIVYLKKLNGGAVFSVGSISWCGSLSYNNYDNDISIMTENVLRKFSSGEILP